jgi:hypothetical protein
VEEESIASSNKQKIFYNGTIVDGKFSGQDEITFASDNAVYTGDFNTDVKVPHSQDFGPGFEYPV